MSISNSIINRRDFLKLSAAGVGSLGLLSFQKLEIQNPETEKLGRITVGKMDLKIRPNENSQTVGALYEDAIIPWQREVIGPHPGRINQRWIETPEGYVWGGFVQPVYNKLNVPVMDLLETSLGSGMWVEVTVPYVDLILENPPARAPWLKYKHSINLAPRFYYSQVIWADQILTDENGQVWYRLNEKFGSGDIFLARAEGLRPLTQEEVEPINPEVENKRIEVNIWYQTLSCFEGDREVFFSHISSGALFDASGNEVDAWSTPIGESPIWRKGISLPLAGGTASAGWSLPAVGWISLFVGTGVAIHSTFWHNNYGEPSSRGCVNASPEAAKWIFRWSNPPIPYDPGDVTIEWPGGTKINVVES